MMWHEFEEIAGYEVSYEDYTNIIEPMYLAIPESFSKQDFVKMIDKKRFALTAPQELLRAVKKEAKHLFEICGHYTDFESEQRMEQAAKKYMKRKYGIDWGKDMEAYCFFLSEYEYPEIQRGCTYPKTLVIGKGNTEYERIQLVK